MMKLVPYFITPYPNVPHTIHKKLTQSGKCYIENHKTEVNTTENLHNLASGKDSLALFVVMFPKAHLTSHSRMSGSR